ncbi:MAG: winged helix-turn-helix domain-containing protein [Paraglaciecola sp.]|uniref:winged helix-turn-helix domain-containing protein n=1 Tax=Paraglaciecola sp. TaxID=1920173 RepID=UPI003296E23E
MHTTSKNNSGQFQIGEWTIVPLENCLLQNDHKIVVIPKVMDLLLYFSKNANQVISIQQLSEAIWPNEFVGDNAIYNLVGQLRKALGDNTAKPVYIETLSKKGYRLIADVTHATSCNATTLPLKKPRKTKLKIKIKKWSVIVVSVLTITYLLSVILSTSEIKTKQLPLAQQHYSLGQFHLNRGKAHNIQKAISYFQLSLSIEPDYINSMLALGFAYWQLSHIEGFAHSTYNNKAKELAKKMQKIAPKDANILALGYLTLPQEKRKLAPHEWLKKYDNGQLTHRTFIAFSMIYFDEGKIDAAIELQNSALSLCANCAYIYNALSTSQLIKGQLKRAFSNFQLYLELDEGQVNNPLKEFGYSNLKLTKLKATTKWIKKNGIDHDALGPKQRNSLALFYLSIRQPQKAQQLLHSVLKGQDNSFFTLYTFAAFYGAEQDHQRSLAFFEKRARLYPDNKRFVISVAYSWWIAGDPIKALDILKRSKVANDLSILQNSTDIGLIQLYGALLLENAQYDQGQRLLETLAKRFEQGLLASSEHAYMAYAQTLSLLGKKQLALQELETTLASGWVEDFNNNWWYLENDPFFKNLLGIPQFADLLEAHKNKISLLTE